MECSKVAVLKEAKARVFLTGLEKVRREIFSS